MKRKEEAMHEVYGYGPGTCGMCQHFARISAGNHTNLFKCRAYGYTNSEATDWKKSSLACGLIDKPIDGLTPLIEVLKHESKKNTNAPVQGQIDMFGRIYDGE